MCNAYNHPPGCTCGWGGDGHTGVRFDYSSDLVITPHIPVYIWRERDQTWPTSCPECGDDVFFIRHNGGSVWVDPPLGWPWPKHACFDKPAEATAKFNLLSAQSSGLTEPKMAVVSKIRRLTRYSEPTVELILLGGDVMTVALRWAPKADEMLGDLVIVSEVDGLLLHPIHAEIPFHTSVYSGVPEPVKKTVSVEWYKCQRCKATVKHGTGHEEHCQKHGARKKLRSSFVQKSEKKKDRSELRYSNAKSTNHTEPPKDSAVQIHPNTKIRVVKQGHETMEQRVAKAVDEVAHQTWVAVSDVLDSDEQWRIAKQKAMALCSALSPSIRKQVRHIFDSQAWRPLLVRKPLG